MPAVNPVCMVCARDFNASCVLAGTKSCGDQGADYRLHRAATHRSGAVLQTRILTNTHICITAIAM